MFHYWPHVGAILNDSCVSGSSLKIVPTRSNLKLKKGIEAENVIFVAGKGSKSFFTDLPTSTDQQEKAQVQDEKLKIAW